MRILVTVPFGLKLELRDSCSIFFYIFFTYNHFVDVTLTLFGGNIQFTEAYINFQTIFIAVFAFFWHFYGIFSSAAVVKYIDEIRNTVFSLMSCQFLWKFIKMCFGLFYCSNSVSLPKYIYAVSWKTFFIYLFHLEVLNLNEIVIIKKY